MEKETYRKAKEILDKFAPVSVMYLLLALILSFSFDIISNCLQACWTLATDCYCGVVILFASKIQFSVNQPKARVW